MRKLVTLEQLLRQAEENGEDPRDLAIDEDDVISLCGLDDGLEENPNTEED